MTRAPARELAESALMGRDVLAASQFERDLQELRAAQRHTDYYSILRLEIDVMRRESPEHSQFLDRYLQQLLPK